MLSSLPVHQQAPVGADAWRVDEPAVTAQAPHDPPSVGVDQREEAAVAAHDQQMAAGDEADASPSPASTTRNGARGRSVRVSAMLIAPSSWPVAIRRPSALTAAA